MGIEIRQAIITDCKTVIEFEEKCFEHPWSSNTIMEQLIDEDSFYMGMYKDCRMIGFGGYEKILEQGHITTIGISSEERNKGYGSLLLSFLEDDAKARGVEDMTLEVRESNICAIKMYEKNGYKAYGTRKNYYADNREDAIIMWKFKDKERIF